MTCTKCKQNQNHVAGTGSKTKKKKKPAKVSGFDINYMKIIASIAGGFIQGYADEYLDKVDQLKQNDDLKDAVKIAAGVWITTMDSGDGSLEGIGMGIASGAGANIVKRYMGKTNNTTSSDTASDKQSGIYGDPNPMLIGTQAVYGEPEKQTEQVEIQYV